ncbi:receptor-like protein EIX2 [Humulus lupulus]|uniref:receptor-like protein EIX2 n=1 Tax=Humulus lupulus TaxID=3486 RepID=UPI002B401797|nr:receptor-like protein EIX2 [Humulus lupulus]
MTMRVFVLLFVVATCHVWSTSSSVDGQCIEKEREALVGFKQGLVDEYNVLSSWASTGGDCCTWRGIRCDNSTHHIIALDLPAQSNEQLLSGQICSSLAELQHLSYLDLSYNNFTNIPEFIGSLSRLTYLDLSYNLIVGIIPSQLGNLTRLEYLNLYNAPGYGQLIGNSIEWLSHLNSLQYFALGNTDFTRATNWFQSFKTASSLSFLALSNCVLPQVDISSLSHSNSSSNSLTDLFIVKSSVHPTTVPWLLNISTSLVNLELSHSDIKGTLPNSFENMRYLKKIDLSANEFEGAIPKSLGNLCSLEYLALEWNKFNTTLDDVLKSLNGCARNSMYFMDLNGNNLRGSFPDDSNTFPPRLQYLSIFNNHLEGPILTNLSVLSDLRVLLANGNMFNGTIPESIGELQYLEDFDFSYNNFSGLVSEVHFRKLSNLKELYLSWNMLTLKFDPTWVPPFDLLSVKLISCKLGPQFPSWLRNQTNISILDISNTEIDDVIPDWFSNHASKLGVLNLQDNQIHGPIPHYLSSVPVLYLSSNRFVTIKDFVCQAVSDKTEVLQVSNNLLFGSLPDCWGNLKSLKLLMLNDNNLSGGIPSSMGFLNKIQYLSLRHNNFSGALPSSMKNCANLQFLDLEDNSLEGEIPTWMGEGLTNLFILGLKSNKFYGSIPSNLCHIRSIQILDLSMNALSGDIPSCINNFTHMMDNSTQKMVIFHSYVIKRRSGTMVYNYNEIAAVKIMWKGRYYQFLYLELLKLIDLSSNKLSGQIPEELTNLVELVQLNLSRNHLYGPIPREIGKMSNLQALDFSNNNLSGTIPTSIEKLSFLANLDLSNNKFSGRIPTATQLQSFNASSFIGNIGLCGNPLPNSCSESNSHHSTNINDSVVNGGKEWFDMSWLKMGFGAGVGVGFAGVSGHFLFNISWMKPFLSKQLR